MSCHTCSTLHTCRARDRRCNGTQGEAGDRHLVWTPALRLYQSCLISPWLPDPPPPPSLILPPALKLGCSCLHALSPLACAWSELMTTNSDPQWLPAHKATESTGHERGATGHGVSQAGARQASSSLDPDSHTPSHTKLSVFNCRSPAMLFGTATAPCLYLV